MVVTLDDFVKRRKKADSSASSKVNSINPAELELKLKKPERSIALTPLGKIRVKQLMLKGKLARHPEPYWWNDLEVPDSIPGCFGDAFDSDFDCEKCPVKRLCKEQARCRSGKKTKT